MFSFKFGQLLMLDGAFVALGHKVSVVACLVILVRGDPQCLGPFHEFATDVIRSIINTDSDRFAAPSDDLIMAADAAFSTHLDVSLNAHDGKFI